MKLEEKKESKKKIEETPKKTVMGLQFRRVIDPDHIPNYLIEQLKERDYDTERFYQWQKANATIVQDGMRIPNPYNHLWVMINEERIVKGFFWATIDTLTKDLIVQNFSVDKDYWNQGEAISKLKEHLIQLMSDSGLKKAVWFTKNPKAYEKHGFKPTKVTMVEAYVDEGKNG